ncbi:MAG: nickel-dependent lactate racemase [Nitrospinae bacterium]|nr:nickel-dependent lactate racemase [Nitrospinota bacterium]
MARITLTNDLFEDFEIEDGRLVGVYGPSLPKDVGLDDEALRERIRNPIGTPPLRKISKGAEKVLIVTDDNTRHTPLHRVIPLITEELGEGGVSDSSVRILIGLGTHRAMSDEEIQHKFGDELVTRFEILNHEWKNPAKLTSLGMSELGFEVLINREIVGADLLISVGSIIPHATAGFSGGAKSVMPGICGESTIEATHWAALGYETSEIIGNFDNKVREAFVRVARRAGLRFIVNTIMIDEERIYDTVAGDVESAHEAGCTWCLEIYGVPVAARADVVVAEAYPSDIDLRQAIKAVCAADVVCRDDGVIILAADCREGISPQFPNFERYGFNNPDTLYRMVEAGEFQERLLAYTLVAIGRIISKRVTGVLVSPHIARKEAERMGFDWAESLSTAVNQALVTRGPDSNVIVLRQAGQTMPVISRMNAGGKVS